MEKAGVVLALLLALRAGIAHAIPVAASIAPIQSLVAGVMGATGTPALLIPGGQSPHTFALKPSTMRAITHARAVFWVGPTLEPALEAALASATQAHVVALIDAPGVKLYPARDFDDPSLDPRRAGAHLTDDPHIWLDTDNARAIIREIAKSLCLVDPADAPAYRANEAIEEQWISSLDEAIRAEIRPIADKRFIVFHDGYQYFERHYGLAFGGAVTEMPGRAPGIRHIETVRNEIRSAHVTCVFSEPQFEPKLTQTITEGLNVRVGVLDALGAEIEPGPSLYFEVMRGLSRSLSRCLSAQ